MERGLGGKKSEVVLFPMKLYEGVNLGKTVEDDENLSAEA